MDPGAFKSLVLSFLETQQSDVTDLELEQDLIASGVLDSFAFIDLCLFLEERLGVQIDVSELDPEEFTNLAGLLAIVHRQGLEP